MIQQKLYLFYQNRGAVIMDSKFNLNDLSNSKMHVKSLYILRIILSDDLEVYQ